MVRGPALAGVPLQRAADQPALFLVQGLPGHCAAERYFNDLARSHSRFIASFPVEELIEGEASDVSRLDAADTCARSSAWNDGAERVLREAVTANSLLTRSYSVERFDTSFVYYVTHFTFYASRWGATSEPFTRHFHHNLDRDLPGASPAVQGGVSPAVGVCAAGGCTA